ncbi:hypothetical protein AB0J38_07230 [Streptomyces sp. NPDC050095]|uniref:DUF6968 family protein n=1 Tax=unclassified Streptomyces TaxID=2593676 RepID=UPI00343AE479
MSTEVADEHPSTLGVVVAGRAFQAVEPDGRVIDLALELGTPRPAPDKDWICPCRIRGLDDSRVWMIYGIDALQALTLANDLLATQIAAFAEERGWTFNWLGAENVPIADVLHKRPSAWDREVHEGHRPPS